MGETTCCYMYGATFYFDIMMFSITRKKATSSFSSDVHEILQATFYWSLGKRQSTSKQLVEYSMWFLCADNHADLLSVTKYEGLGMRLWQKLPRVWSALHNICYMYILHNHTYTNTENCDKVLCLWTVSQYVHPAISIIVLFPKRSLLEWY